jgi:archaetidylinositol phosphate synthase
MFENLRGFSKRLITPMARGLLAVGLSADAVTSLGLILSFIYLVFIMLHSLPLAIFFMIASAVMDALDGEVARLKGMSGPRGAFLDSTLDRVEDLVYLIGLLLLGYSSVAVTIAVGGSLITSYIRAKAESLGQTMRGRGILERGDRLIIIFIILILTPFEHIVASYLIDVFALLTVITFVQRIFIGYRSIR